jgi:hypothetical protein
MNGCCMKSIHDVLTASLSDLGLPAPTDIIQTVLLRDRQFVGWKFRYGGGYAILRLANLELYDEQGTLLKTVTVEEKKDVAA